MDNIIIEHGEARWKFLQEITSRTHEKMRIVSSLEHHIILQIIDKAHSVSLGNILNIK